MTQIFRCDICEKEIENIAIGTHSGWSIHYPHDLKEDALHFCEKCTKLFYKWLEEARR